MRASVAAAVLVSLLVPALGTLPRAAACSLPLDPEVAIFLAGRTAYDPEANHDRGFVVDEDVPVMWQAYWNASEYGNMPLVHATLGAPDFVFEGNELYELQRYYEVVGGGKLKVSEIWDRALGGGWQTRPDCPAIMDAPIQDATWQGTFTGDSSQFLGGPPASPIAMSPIYDGASRAAAAPSTGTWTISNARWHGGAGKWMLVPGSVTMNWELDCEPQVWNGDMPATASADQVTVTYPTPTGNEARIHVSSSLCLAFEYIPEGAVFKWTETLVEAGEEVDRNECGVSWTGQIQKDTGGSAGELSEAWVRVLDTTPPQHFKADPEVLPDGKVGKPATGQITFKVLDNNPFADEDGQPTGHIYYSTLFHGWEHVAGDRPLCGGVNAHPRGCDCQAYHTEKWLWKYLPLDYGGFQVIEEGGQPAYCYHTFTVDAATLEALPWHYADGAAEYSYESADYTGYQPDRMKYFMVCEAPVTGAAVACSLTDGQEDPSAKEPASSSDGYVVAGGISTIAKKDAVMPPEGNLLSEIGASGETWDKWGKYGTMGVADDAMPDIRVYVTDTRYNQTFMYGHNDAGDGKISGYQSAKDAGSGDSSSNTADSPYKSGDDAPASWTFGENGQDGGYALQLSMIAASAFAPAQNIVEGAPWGFWTDEDTRLVFRVVCRDNMNRWRETLSYTKELTDGPRGVTLSGDQLPEDGSGNFEYIFHDPNRGANAIAEPCQLKVTTSDANGRSRELVIDIFVASNDLRLQTLEEERKRVNQTW